MTYARLSNGRNADALSQLMSKPAEPAKAKAPTWAPPDGVTTAADYTIAKARDLIGRDAIVREDPYFGRRGLIKKIIPDAEHGFLVAVIVYKRDKNRFTGRWEVLDKPPDAARKFLAPGRVEISTIKL